jgi:ERCC4-related helicase
LAIVRNRPAVIARVEQSAVHTTGLVHLVTVDYTDLEGAREETVVWEREPDARVIQGNGLPRVADHAPMLPADFSALQRSARWGAIHPFVDPDDTTGPLSRLPFSSPLHGAIEVEDYQMVPLLKAMRMPRVSLLLADDVGLGKTVEAGLILSELVLQRRIQRILILTPASLRQQWQQEMHEKFCLHFDIVDRPQTTQLRRRLGLDANPWRASPHVIASYHYLKQPDVLEDFLATCRVPDGSPHLPWDLIIVDEAHNLAPAAFGEDSDLSSMLRRIAPQFEHKIFATATPHNGRTRCFSGLLEILDPARFSQTSEFTPAERARVQEVVVRRLKSEINAVTSPPRFSERHLGSVPLALSREEQRLSAAFSSFRSALHEAIARASHTERVAGAFAIEVFGKRLLSSLHAFADSWHRLVAGCAPEAAPAISSVPVPVSDVRASERAVREDTGDDTEQESRTAYAAQVIGGWLRPLAPSLQVEMERVTAALADLGMAAPVAATRPKHDTRYAALVNLIRQRLRTPDGKAWLPGERLVVFTEYKTTLDALVTRLRADFPDDGAIVHLFGSGDMDEREKEAVKTAFNDPASAARILVATDAASEGLNLQRTARYLHHYDVPWNPARLEQRNGRIDRYGQARDVTVSHFISDDDADIAFMAFIVAKVHQIRHDLGATGEVIDAAVQRRLIQAAPDADLRLELERDLSRLSGAAEVPHDATARSRDLSTAGQALGEQLSALRRELDLSGDALRTTVESALAHSAPPPRLQPDGRPGFWRLVQPIPANWRDVIDDTLRLRTVAGAALGALPAIAFEPTACVSLVSGRPIFRPPADAALLHLWHPVVQHTLAHYARRRFPGQPASASRWRVSHDARLPATVDAWVLVTLEELAVNDLRETFHHWVRTVVFPVFAGRLGPALAHVSADQLALDPAASPPPSARLLESARDLFIDHEEELRSHLAAHTARLTASLRSELATESKLAREREQSRFQSRQAELSALITERRLDKLERELDQLRAEEGSLLFDPDGYTARLRLSADDKQAELARIRRHTEDLREQLTRERDRIMNQLLPRRHALRGEAQCLPVSVEIRFREVSA